jgi:hypothetical protein
MRISKIQDSGGKKIRISAGTFFKAYYHIAATVSEPALDFRQKPSLLEVVPVLR